MRKDTFPKNSNNQRVFIERRQKKDWLVRSVSIIAVAGWFIAFVALIIIDQAKPETEDFFSRLLNYRVRNYWDITLLRVSIGVLAVSFVTCITGFIVNMSRHRRETDRYNKSIIILGAVTFIMMIIFIKKLV